MSEPFLGEIRIFPYNFAPRGWAFCNGQLLPVAQNTALFSLLGTAYGGDGRTNFGLPNLQGRFPLHPGRGPGLTQRRQGETGGSTEVPLTAAHMPAHRHQAQAYDGLGARTDPAGRTWAAGASGRQGVNLYRGAPSEPSPMHSEALAPAGGDDPHNNIPPYLALHFCIALVGLYPTRN